MPFSPHFDDYGLRVWVDETVDNFGLRWVNTTAPNFTFPLYTINGVDVEGVSLSNHHVDVGGSGRLKVELEAVPCPSTGALTYVSYSFNFVSRGVGIFRYDNHPEQWFERLHGTTCHVHVGQTDKYPTGVVEFDTAVEAAVTFVSTNTFVPNTSPFVLNPSTTTSAQFGRPPK